MKCRDCRFYQPLVKPVRTWDGQCGCTKHVGRNRHLPYYVTGAAKACFDAEEPWPVERDQMGLFEEGET